MPNIESIAADESAIDTTSLTTSTFVGARMVRNSRYQPSYEATQIPRTWVSQTEKRAAIKAYLERGESRGT